MKRLVALLTIVFTLGALWFTGGALADPAPSAQQVLRFVTTPPETLDPAKISLFDEQELVVNLFEGLTRLGPGEVPVPGAAQSWTISPDGLVYTFTLRESQWSNGDPVTAQDFEYAWKRLLNPKTHSDFAFELYCLRNGEEYNKGEIFDEDQVGVKALDNRTLQVTLKEPAPYFLTLTAYPYLMPVHRKTVETRPLTWFFQPETLVSNGPFRLTKKTSTQLDLSRNTLYWDVANVVLERIEFLLEEDSIEMSRKDADQFTAGKLDILEYPLLSDLKKWQAHPGYKKEPRFGVVLLYFNSQKAPFDDKRVRQALFLVIDREKLIADTYRTSFPALTLVPGGTQDLTPGTDFRAAGGNYLTSGSFAQDLAKAKSLLAEAGYPNGKGLKVEIIVYEDDYQEPFLAVQSMWQKNLNIRVTVTKKSWKQKQQSLNEGAFQVAHDVLWGYYSHPFTLLEVLASSSHHESGWNNPAYDELLAKARTAQNPAASLAAMHQAEALLMDEVPVVPLVFYSHPVVYQPWVKGVHYSVMSYYDFKSTWIETH